MEFTIVDTPTTVCIGCGGVFASAPGKTRCKVACGRVQVRDRTGRTRRDGTRGEDGITRFIGVDGEGETDELTGEHRYVLFSMGDLSLDRGGAHLSLRDVLDFLWENHRQNYAYVGYFLGYDFTQWVRGMSEPKARKLFTREGIDSRKRDKARQPFPVRVLDDSYEIDFLALKRFKFRRVGSKHWFTICDAGSFFQTSLLNAIDPAAWERPIVTDEEFQIIVEGKSDRAGARLGDAMRRYNVLENEILQRLMRELDKGYMHCGVKLDANQWFGPGQVASAWLENVDSIRNDELVGLVPSGVIDGARASYYGGWFDIMCHGHVPRETYEYDINSAYPYIIARLPCLRHGRWTPWREGQHTDHTLVYATVDCPTGFPVLPHRDQHGHILRPRRTAGWYWHDELLAASALGTTFHVEHGWTFLSGCDCRPYAAIEDLYYERLRVGKNSPAGKAIKTLINSVYGKFAQSVGAPKWANSIYASLITSGTRRMIIDAIATHPNPTSTVMVATDGVYFRERHPGLDISPSKLGAWDEGVKTNLTLLMPGVYWDDKARGDLASAKLRSRGVSARDLINCVEEFDRAFDTFNGIDWPARDVPITFGFMGPKQALHQNAWHDVGKIVRGAVKTLVATPVNKRMPVAAWDGDVWRSYPYAVAPDGVVESLPYDKTFGIDYGIDGAMQLFSPDGMAFSGIV